MGKSSEQQWEHFEKEEAQYQKRVEAILWKEGHVAWDQQQAGFKVILYGGLTFVYFKDPGDLYNNREQRAKVIKYQEALHKNDIRLDFYDEDPSTPYLIG